MIVAANHVRDAHVDVVGDDRQVIDRQAVRAQDDEVFDLLVIDLDVAAHMIGVRRLPRRHFEPQRRLHAGCFESLLLVGGKMQAGAIVFPAAAGFLCRLTFFLQPLRRAVALVRKSARQQLMRDGSVALEALRLKIGRVRSADAGTFVPFEPEPAHRLENAGHHLVGRSLRIGIFDAKNEGAAVPPREQPVEERRARAADVQIAGRRRRESNPRAIHGGSYRREISIVSAAARCCEARRDRPAR